MSTAAIIMMSEMVHAYMSLWYAAANLSAVWRRRLAHTNPFYSQSSF